MGKLGIIGGIVAIAGAALILVHAIIAIDILTLGLPNLVIAWIINLVVIILAFIGAILGFAGKRLGGILVLIAGLMAMGLPVLASIIGDGEIASMLIQFSYIYYLWEIPLFTVYTPMLMQVSIESLIIVIGGVLVLAGPSD